MARPAKYVTADDIINRCQILEHNGCMVWPDETDSPTRAVLSPASPMAVKMFTNSIPRILFILCRHLPAGRRLTQRCSTPNCVNPWHYSEPGSALRQRQTLREKGLNPTELLPKQQSSRHLSYPSDEVIEECKPKDPAVLRLMAMSASVAGIDGKGLPNVQRRNYVTPPPPVADPNAPVLVIRKRQAPRSTPERQEPESQVQESQEDFDSFFDILENDPLRQANPRKYGMDA